MPEQESNRSGHRYAFCEDLIIDRIIKGALIEVLAEKSPKSIGELAEAMNTLFSTESIRPDMCKEWCTALGIEVERRSVFKVPTEVMRGAAPTEEFPETEAAPASAPTHPVSVTPGRPPIPDPNAGGIMG